MENQKQSLDAQLSGLTLTALVLQSLTLTAQLLTMRRLKLLLFCCA